MGLPWDVYATPIAARKLARLGIEHGEVVLRPAFYRQLGASYGVVSRATCPLEGHDAPGAECSCGFYAVADETQLWRLGADEPELAVLDVELAGRIIEHDHGYRASDQTVRSVRFHGVCVRCGRQADVFGQRRFGGLVPACRRCARRALEPAAVADALGVPVELTTEPDNLVSQRVIETNGGVFVEEFTAPPGLGSKRGLRYRIALEPATPAHRA